MTLDTATKDGARADGRLRVEAIIWLTTVTPEGQPQSSPVWFLWDGAEFLVYSTLGTPRLANVARNPRVTLNLNCTPTGDEVVTIEGEARIDEAAPPSFEVPAYLAKYAPLLERYGWTPQWFDEHYPRAVRISPTRWRLF